MAILPTAIKYEGDNQTFVWKHPSEIKELKGTDMANAPDAPDLLVLKVKKNQMIFIVTEEIIDEDSPYYDNYRLYWYRLLIANLMDISKYNYHQMQRHT